MPNPRAYISLGSNLGDSRQMVLAALAELQQFSDEPVVASSLWQTTPVDCPPGSPKFVNAAAAILVRAGESPESLLGKLQLLEDKFGRQKKKILNEPRPLDLDLICFGAEIRNTPRLILPHPRAGSRRFVLQPLSEIAPEMILPGNQATIRQLLAGLADYEMVSKI